MVVAPGKVGDPEHTGHSISNKRCLDCWVRAEIAGHCLLERLRRASQHPTQVRTAQRRRPEPLRKTLENLNYPQYSATETPTAGRAMRPIPPAKTSIGAN